MQNYELLGHFYLGKTIDPQSLQRTDEYLLYDSKDLSTHAMCVGMTGSGKTGLGIGLLEEAAMDNIPALIIDPKGDMSNLLLTFPELKPEDFLPWLLASDAERAGLSMEDYAKKKAEDWKNGLAEWEQDGSRIAALKEKAEFAVYTPGSSSGRPLSIVRMLDCPNQEVLADSETLQDYTTSTISALLSLLNINADPLQSKEHILLSTLLNSYWSKGQSLDLATLIQLIANPGIEKIGVLPLETFYPQHERMQLAMQFNNLLASPQFSSWLEGEPLNIQNLLYSASGKPKMSILSINHLDDQERMFFVSTFLNQVVSWMRTQSGTSSLRAILYMDEIFGYFPPVANPPSKKPLLNLLKQARAFGLGIVLATQNPADLDYKGLANIGTWFVGRLQTEQDKARLLDGLQTASQSGSAQGLSVDRQALSDLLSKLPARSFLMNNVHDNAPTLFGTRWCMSYLAGPLSRQQIAQLDQGGASAASSVSSEVPVGSYAATADNTATATGQVPPIVAPIPDADAASTHSATPEQVPVSESATGNASFSMPLNLPKDVEQYYLPVRENVSSITYVPSVYGFVETTYEDKGSNLFEKETSTWNTTINSSAIPVNWEDLTHAVADPYDLEKSPVQSASFSSLPDAASKKSSYTQWSKDLIDYIYRNEVYSLYSNEKKTLISEPGEKKNDFIVRLRQYNREERDKEMEVIKEKYAKKIATLEERIRKAEQAVQREKDQANQAKFSTMINVGNTLLDTLLGNKRGFKKSTIGKAASSARAAGRSRQQQGDVARAEETVLTYQEQLQALELDLENELQVLADTYSDKEENFKELQIKPKKKDIIVKVFGLLWLPYESVAGGQLRPLYDVAESEE